MTAETLIVRPALKARMGWIIVVAFLATAVAAQYAVVADDVVWQLWMGDQINHGFSLYVDLKEPNPPLWIWLGAGATWLATQLHVAPIAVYFALITLIGQASLYLFWHFMADIDPSERRTWTVSYGVSLFVIGFFAFGQREHLLAMGALPYAGLIAARLRHRAPPVPVVFATACLAAFGFALKHYFLIVPMGLEILLLCHVKRHWRPRLEHAVLFLAALIYAVAIALCTPDFLTSMIAQVRLTYGAFNNPVSSVVPSAVLVLIGVYLAGRVRNGHVSLIQTISVVAVAAASAFALQQKGWMYHEMAMMIAVLSLNLAGVAIGLRHFARAGADRRIGTAAQLLFCLLALSYSSLFGIRNAASSYHTPDLPFDLSAGQTIALLSSAGGDYLQYTTRAGARWGQGYLMTWPLPAVAQATHAHQLTPALQKIADDLRRDMVDDLTCQPPDILIESTGHKEHVHGDVPFDYIGFFSQDARFRSLFKNYRMIGIRGHLNFYQRISPIAPVADCKPFVTTDIFGRHS